MLCVERGVCIVNYVQLLATCPQMPYLVENTHKSCSISDGTGFLHVTRSSTFNLQITVEYVVVSV